MSAVLNTNIASLWASKNLQTAQSKMADSVERLSSGLRINRAKDDAAGLAIGNQLTAQINTSNQGIRNLNDGISMVQTAESGLSSASEMAQRILTLATQASSGSSSDESRGLIKDEMQQIIRSINSIATRTAFGGKSLLDGSLDDISVTASKEASDSIQLSNTAFAAIGNSGAGGTPTALEASDIDNAPENTTVSIKVYVQTDVGVYKAANLVVDDQGSMKLNGKDVDIDEDITVYSMADATDGLSKLLSDEINVADGTATSFDNIITLASSLVDDIGSQRAKLGAYQNQLEYAVNQVADMVGNLSAARSRVMDTDYANETASLTKGQILQQAATAMLAQANQMPNVILSLLK